MNVGAFLSAVSRPPAERGPSLGPAADPAREPSDPLSVLENFVEAGNESRKVLARERLDHLKEQMNTLMLFDLAPGFLVSHTARMTRELEAAATDFAIATKALAARSNASAQPDAGAALSSEAAKTSAQETSGLPPAYLWILETGGLPSGLARGPAALLSPEDAETAGGFASVAHHLRFVIELAADGSGHNGPSDLTADAARKSAARVIDTMASLQGPAGATALYL
ncbi:MAG: hypothetical protein RIC18_06720 [Hoeflea sp.]|uniref:hypothetical protein n=1 Tax=Hoeflea sp. TaxID=1940281 RepID=UPI0032EC8B09